MRRLASVGVLVLLLAAKAGATSGEYVDVTCPVCGNAFEGYEVHSTNTFRGQDRDFLSHAAGGQAFLLGCWTCPSCLWTGFSDDFAPDAVPAALRERLRAERPLRAREAVDPKTKRTTDLPALVRWDLRTQVLALRGATARERADAFLCAAWTQRFEGGAPDEIALPLGWLVQEYRTLPEVTKRPSAYEVTLAAASRMEKDAAAEGPLTRHERALRLLAAGTSYKSRGEDPDARRALARLRALEDLPEAFAKAADDLERRIAVEREYLERALAPLAEAAGDAGADPGERAALRYLAGELQRKTGRLEASVSTLEGVLETKDLSPHLTAYATDALARAKAALEEEGRPRLEGPADGTGPR